MDTKKAKSSVSLLYPYVFSCIYHAASSSIQDDTSYRVTHTTVSAKQTIRCRYTHETLRAIADV